MINYKILKIISLVLMSFFSLSVIAQTDTSISSAAEAVSQISGSVPGIPAMKVTTNADGSQDYTVTLQILGIMTVLTLLPSFLIMMTSFTRIIIVFAILRQALGLQGTPSSQILLGLSLFLTIFIMMPVFQQVNDEALQPYIDLIQTFNPDTERNDLTLYPGSPAVAKHFMRRQDSTHLFELHPTDIQHLTNYCYRWKKAFIKQSDGYQGVLGLLPPPSRRGVVLIDPPYELKEDYQKAVNTIIKAYSKFATGTYILWYPVVKRELVTEMKHHFTQKNTNNNVKNLLQIEFCLSADSDEYGMTGTGLFIVNPPWQLSQQMSHVLPYLKEKLGNHNASFSVCQLIEE